MSNATTIFPFIPYDDKNFKLLQVNTDLIHTKVPERKDLIIEKLPDYNENEKLELKYFHDVGNGFYCGIFIDNKQTGFGRM